MILAGRPSALRTAVLYAVIVGLPIAGAFLVLERGRAFAAPPAVWGTWTLDPVSGEVHPPCPSANAALPKMLVITQSGGHLAISVGHPPQPPLMGELRPATDDGPAVITNPLKADSAWPAGTVVSIKASISSGIHLDGTITTTACSQELTTTFRANRQVGQRPEEGGH